MHQKWFGPKKKEGAAPAKKSFFSSSTSSNSIAKKNEEPVATSRPQGAFTGGDAMSQKLAQSNKKPASREEQVQI